MRSPVTRLWGNSVLMASSRLAWLLAWLLVAPVVGCDDWLYEVEKPSDPRGGELDDPAQVDESAVEETRAREQAAATAVGRDPARGEHVTLADAPEPEEPVAEEPPTEPEPEPAEPERDLSAELRGMVGDPAGCLADVTRSVSDLTVTVRASTSVTGIVTRSSVGGAGLSESARECIRRRLDGARFRGPVPDAPREVTAELVLRRQPPPATPSDGRDADERGQTRGTWRYGIFYPGGAPEEEE